METIVRRRSGLLIIASLTVHAATLHAQYGFTSAFSPTEFAARRAKVMERIGDGIAVIQGGAAQPASMVFRQNNHFFYLSGVEASRAVEIVRREVEMLGEQPDAVGDRGHRGARGRRGPRRRTLLSLGLGCADGCTTLRGFGLRGTKGRGLRGALRR